MALLIDEVNSSELLYVTVVEIHATSLLYCTNRSVYEYKRVPAMIFE